MSYLLAIDQGTTSSRAIIFSSDSTPISSHQMDLTQYYPHQGWVEQDPMEMWRHTLECCQQAITKSQLSANDIAAIGITNQRETTIIWDKTTGQPIYPAIVWQDRRTQEICSRFAEHAITSKLQDKTGLLLDPYFSATKIIWLLENISGARARTERGELLFGTVDTFILWHLTGGKVHATDATNASRTLLFNIKTQQWDSEILTAFNIPEKLLPDVLNSSDDYGVTTPELFGKPIRICSVIGDQQAATVGQACFIPGMIKSTYGTGAFMLLNTGDEIVHSQNRLLTTVAYRLKNHVTYGLEGSIFAAGTIVKWLRDTLQLIQKASESEHVARSIDSTHGVYLIPAFTGLGAPNWRPDVKAALVGLTYASGRNEIVRAGLEAVVYQTRDLLEAMLADSSIPLKILRVDGGMAANQWLMQFLADILQLEIQIPFCLETTALGAAYLAGLQVGLYGSLNEIAQHWRAKQAYGPVLAGHQSKRMYAEWRKVIEAFLK